MNEKRERYNSLDGLRAFAALGILVMHVYVNFGYEINHFIFNNVISVFGELIYLFMLLSGFSMCCGYYSKISNGTTTPNQFYCRRFSRIWPYFAVLVILDIIVDPSLGSLYEAFADLTLAFSLLPCSTFQVIGVARTLGVIFLFYMLFPYFCFLLNSKKRAWFSFGIALIYNYTCSSYFFGEHFGTEDFSLSNNFLYCAIFFIAGGIIYLYRDALKNFASKFRWPLLIFNLILTTVVLKYIYAFGKGKILFSMQMLILFSAWLIYALGAKGLVLDNKFTHFISGISMEIYLSHMAIFRVVEKLHLSRFVSGSLALYVCELLLTAVGTIIFAYTLKQILRRLSDLKIFAV